MLVTIDKRGSINLPAALRKELGLKNGSYLTLEVVEGGVIMLLPVAIYPTIRLNDKGLAKLQEARESGTGKLPKWLIGDMENQLIMYVCQCFLTQSKIISQNNHKSSIDNRQSSIPLVQHLSDGLGYFTHN